MRLSVLKPLLFKFFFDFFEHALAVILIKSFGPDSVVIVVFKGFYHFLRGFELVCRRFVLAFFLLIVREHEEHIHEHLCRDVLLVLRRGEHILAL